MKRHLLFAALAALAPWQAFADESSWIFRPSYYSHSPDTGERVAQYQPNAPAYRPADDTYQESAYRHNHSSVRVGTNGDNLHIVQTWGQGAAIRPYGEWLRPFRAGATPFGPWGNPQGPWTLPFDSWQNPYGLGQLPHPPYPFSPYPQQGPLQQGMPRGRSGGGPVAPQGGMPMPQAAPMQ